MRPTRHDTAVGLQQLRFAAPTPSGPSPVRAPTETSSHFLRAPAVSPAPRPSITRNTSSSTARRRFQAAREALLVRPGLRGAQPPAISPTVAALKEGSLQARSCVHGSTHGRVRNTVVKAYATGGWADGRVGWRLGLSAASNDDGEEWDQPFGAGGSAAQSDETKQSRETIRVIDAVRILPFATH